MKRTRIFWLAVVALFFGLWLISHMSRVYPSRRGSYYPSPPQPVVVLPPSYPIPNPVIQPTPWPQVFFPPPPVTIINNNPPALTGDAWLRWYHQQHQQQWVWVYDPVRGKMVPRLVVP